MDKLKVLFVEDDKRIQVLYNKAFDEVLFEKRFASNGLDGLELYDAWNPDIIVVDRIMPYMTGEELVAEIRTKREDTTTTVVIATSRTAKPDVLECVNLGIQGYIAKPIDYKTVEMKVLRCHIEANPTVARHFIKGLKTLIAEPSGPAKELYQKGLPEDVFDLKFCETVAEAQEVYASWLPDLLVTELTLPDKSGKELIKTIREKEISTTIVVITQEKDKQHVSDCIELGIQAYILKPVQEDTVAAKILKSYLKTNPERTTEAIRELKALRRRANWDKEQPM